MDKKYLTLAHIRNSKKFYKELLEKYPEVVDKNLIDYVIKDLDNIEDRVSEL